MCDRRRVHRAIWRTETFTLFLYSDHEGFAKSCQDLSFELRVTNRSPSLHQTAHVLSWDDSPFPSVHSEQFCVMSTWRICDILVNSRFISSLIRWLWHRRVSPPFTKRNTGTQIYGYHQNRTYFKNNFSAKVFKRMHYWDHAVIGSIFCVRPSDFQIKIFHSS
jgi:hypothetical protein